VQTLLVEKQIPDRMKARGMTKEQVINDVLLAAQSDRFWRGADVELRARTSGLSADPK
jgi:3-hydroxybutyrate dehydrogenase